MITSRLKVNYFVSDAFKAKYPSKDDILYVENDVERGFVESLGTKCQNMHNYKQELSYKLRYYYNSNYRGALENEMRNLDFSSCDKYNHLINQLR